MNLTTEFMLIYASKKIAFASRIRENLPDYVILLEDNKKGVTNSYTQVLSDWEYYFADSNLSTRLSTHSA